MLCLITCFFNCLAYVVGWVVLVVTALKVALGPVYFQTLRGRAFAYLMNKVIKEEFMIIFHQCKQELFSSMKNLESSDKELSKKKALNILEVIIDYERSAKRGAKFLLK